jgi:hypothetical protein
VAVDERERCYDKATFAESFVILNAARQECADTSAIRFTGPRLTTNLGREFVSGISESRLTPG